MGINGMIIAIGGNEDKGLRNTKRLHVQETDLDFATSGILCRILSELDNDHAPVEIITSASGSPEKAGKNYIRAFKKLGHKKVNVLDISDREEAESPEIISHVSDAACIMFSGGDQFKLI